MGPVWDTLLDGAVRGLVERDLLCPFLHRQPWFQGPRPRSARFTDWGLLRRGTEPIFVTIVEAELDDPSEEGGHVSRTYFVPLALSSAENARLLQERYPHAVLARVTGARKGVLYDAWHDVQLGDQLREAVVSLAGTIAMRHGQLAVQPRGVVPANGNVSTVSDALTTPGGGGTVHRVPLALKLFRRIEPGVHPEVEIAEHLAHVGFARVPVVGAVFDYARSGQQANSVGMLTLPSPSVDGQADGWTHGLDWLSRLFDHVAGREPSASARTPPPPQDVSTADPVRDAMSGYLDIAAALGRRTAQMHLALADSTDPRFAPERLSREDLAIVSTRALAQAERTLGSLEAALSSPHQVSMDVAARATAVLKARVRLLDGIRSAAALIPTVSKIRIHGDYRLGQVLLAEGDIYIHNIEGHLAWPAAAQREKQSALKDVAGMLRSFSYAAHAALLTHVIATPDKHLAQWARTWHTWTTAAFLDSYYSTAAASPTLTGTRGERETLLRFFLLDRALRELDGELTNRAEWIGIPLSGILELLGE